MDSFFAGLICAMGYKADFGLNITLTGVPFTNYMYVLIGLEVLKLAGIHLQFQMDFLFREGDNCINLYIALGQ